MPSAEVFLFHHPLTNKNASPLNRWSPRTITTPAHYAYSSNLPWINSAIRSVSTKALFPASRSVLFMPICIAHNDHVNLHLQQAIVPPSNTVRTCFLPHSTHGGYRCAPSICNRYQKQGKACSKISLIVHTHTRLTRLQPLLPKLAKYLILIVSKVAFTL